MSKTNEASFYMKFVYEGDKLKRHEISSTLDGFAIDLKNEEPATRLEDTPPVENVNRLPFRSVMDEFKQAMDIYLTFIPMLLSMMQMIPRFVFAPKILELAEQRGTLREDVSNKNEKVFEIPTTSFREIAMYNDDLASSTEGIAHLPQIIIIGLIGAYDNHLAKLLKLVFVTKPEMILTSAREIKFSDLMKFNNLDEVRDDILNREVEGVIRKSHHEQFDAMQTLFKIPLRDGLDVWPTFIELCERRNLFTHTGGTVSSQYLKNCQDHGFDCKNIRIGNSLDVNPNYLRKAVYAVCEIGVKLNYVLWRKFNPNEKQKADQALNEITYDLIFKRHCALAEALLRFTYSVLKKSGGEEKTRRMMLINLANAIRLQKGRGHEAKALLASEDWSASGDDFQACVAAINEDLAALLPVMIRIGKFGSITKEDYRTWPTFRKLREETGFKETFEQIFGEQLIQPSVVEDSKEVEDKNTTKFLH